VPRTPRESDRYARASRREQLGDEFRTLTQSPRLLILLALLFGGWLFFQLTAPKTVRLEDLAVGQCLHVPTSANSDVAAVRPIGEAVEVSDVLATQGAALAPCDGSHSHEVAAVFVDADSAGAVFPGESDLQTRHAAECNAAFASYIGHAVDMSAFSLTIVVQRVTGWDSGRRAGACLVSDSAGQFLMAPAKGAGR
jgi:hypothetical protein